MSRNLLALLLAVAAGAALVGCGAGDSGPAGNTLNGRVATPVNGSLPNTLAAEIVGTNISAPVNPDGSFTLTVTAIGTVTVAIVNTATPDMPPVAEETVTVNKGTNQLPPLQPPVTYTPSANASISGTVYEGPISPTVSPGQPSEKPYAGAVMVAQQTNGNFSVTITSTSDGTFSVPVPAGVYVVTPQSGPNGYPRAAPFQLTVLANAIANVQVQYDTGIR